MDWELLRRLGRKVYKCEDWRDYKRYYVFLTRCKLHEKAISEHVEFFKTTEARRLVMENCPWFIDQATRQVFYKDSSFGERAYYVRRHILWMEKLFTPPLLERLYIKGERVPLWKDEFEGKPLILYLVFRDGQQKEGCLSLELVWDSEDEVHTSWDYGTHVYQIMFTLGDGPKGAGADPNSLTIGVGALQGLSNGAEVIKNMTKAFFGYRPKNLILWCLRCLAETIGAQRIIAVSNEGYYAMNHWRMDRKLKVDLNAFWQEAEGKACADPGFMSCLSRSTGRI
jgi:uncharacterized protein VirK/YbjX